MLRLIVLLFSPSDVFCIPVLNSDGGTSFSCITSSQHFLPPNLFTSLLLPHFHRSPQLCNSSHLTHLVVLFPAGSVTLWTFRLSQLQPQSEHYLSGSGSKSRLGHNFPLAECLCAQHQIANLFFTHQMHRTIKDCDNDG